MDRGAERERSPFTRVDSALSRYEVLTTDEIECGQLTLKHFPCHPRGDQEECCMTCLYNNVGLGSFGYPNQVRDQFQRYRDQAQSTPDQFARHAGPALLQDARHAVANHLQADVKSCGFLPSTMLGLRTVLNNVTFDRGDVIVYACTAYPLVQDSIQEIAATAPVASQRIDFTFPVSDDEICRQFEQAFDAVRARGENPRLAIFETVVSLPSVRLPFERLVALCRIHGVLSCIDGAHSIGQLDVHLRELDPDFYAANCHKWMLVPPDCAVFYVPARNQHLLPAEALAISHGQPTTTPRDPTPAVTEGYQLSYLSIPAAFQWRSRLTFRGARGEPAIRTYLQHLARAAGQMVSDMLGTEVLDNAEQTLGRCAFANVRLPLSYTTLAGGDPARAKQITSWMARSLVHEYSTHVLVMLYADQWWVRLVARVYLTLDDFQRAGQCLKQVCERVQKDEWRTSR